MSEFEKLLLSELVDFLKKSKISEPTEVQKETIGIFL